MKCPECKTSFETADDGDDGDLPVHNCATCSGTWIRGQSLNRLMYTSRDAAAIAKTLDTILDLKFNNSRRKCPSCRGRKLKTVVIEKTELDFCASCKGMFFDPGELDRVFPGILNQSEKKHAGARRGFWPSLLKYINHK
jgi:Zn-finger nucleic acid-binding protein